MGRVMTGPEIKAARERARMTQQQLAARIGVGLRTVGNWERGETVPQNRMAALEALFVDAPATPLQKFTDAQIIAELARRAAERDSHSNSA